MLDMHVCMCVYLYMYIIMYVYMNVQYVVVPVGHGLMKN